MGIKVKAPTVTAFYIEEYKPAPADVAALNAMLRDGAETLARAKRVTRDVVIVPYDVATRIGGNYRTVNDLDTYVLCATCWYPREDGIRPYIEGGWSQPHVYITQNPRAALPPAALKWTRTRKLPGTPQWWPLTRTGLVERRTL